MWLQCSPIVWGPACCCPLTQAFSCSTLLLLASTNSASQAVKGLWSVPLEKAQLAVYNPKPLHFPVLYLTLSAFRRELRVKETKTLTLSNTSLQGFFKGNCLLIVTILESL